MIHFRKQRGQSSCHDVQCHLFCIMSFSVTSKFWSHGSGNLAVSPNSASGNRFLSALTTGVLGSIWFVIMSDSDVERRILCMCGVGLLMSRCWCCEPSYLVFCLKIDFSSWQAEFLFWCALAHFLLTNISIHYLHDERNCVDFMALGVPNVQAQIHIGWCSRN